MDNFLYGLSTELYAASYFADLGYKIYWHMETQSRADFVIEKDGVFQKIQVKKATWSQTGPYKYLQCRLKSRNKCREWYSEGDYDLLVIVDKPRIWIAPFSEVNELVSVCFDGTKPGYKTRSKLYDPDKWLVKEVKEE